MRYNAYNTIEMNGDVLRMYHLRGQNAELKLGVVLAPPK
jgi:hypothetical protein